MKLRADKIRPGNMVVIDNGCHKILECHLFPAIPMGGGAHTPPCVLLICSDDVAFSFHPDVKIEMAKVAI